MPLALRLSWSSVNSTLQITITHSNIMLRAKTGNNYGIHFWKKEAAKAFELKPHSRDTLISMIWQGLKL